MQITNDVKKRSKLKRWYKFNKQKLPMFLTIIASIAFTGFLDFQLKNQENKMLFELKSHFTTNNMMGHENGGPAMFMIFILNILAMIQIFNTVNFSGKRSPVNLYLITGLTVLQLASFGYYLSLLFAEQAIRPSFVISQMPSAIISITVFTIGIIIQLASTVLAFMYVDWKYVKIEE